MSRPWSRGIHERHIREGIGISPTRYWQVLTTLLRSPEARKAEPIVMRLLEEKLNRRRIARGEPPLNVTNGPMAGHEGSTSNGQQLP
ncbi:DUF3263 domain-containing protein [Streptomyces sp. NPDC001933]|uniref:DUF3263 domain-containing protein n=1 Tax=Streptomyces sp. NPDC001933 TaxID=3364626 RepID=UPI0036A732CE